MTAAQHTAGPWRNYAESRPSEAGPYQWRLPSISLAGAFVIFHAHMRMRGNGYSDPILSPSFDHWDGYTVHVPAGAQWREPNPAVKCARHETTGLAIEGLEFAACLYCGNVPMLEGLQAPPGGGVVCNANPQHMNRWRLKCCAWGSSPTLADPREIERIRRAAIAKTEAA
jgi:hypothetical protein